MTRCDGTLTSIIASVLLLVAAHLPAYAATPAFCRDYGKSALVQVRGGLSDSSCGLNLQGARWSSDFAVHYEWCLGASDAEVASERGARTRYLSHCGGK